MRKLLLTVSTIATFIVVVENSFAVNDYRVKTKQFSGSIGGFAPNSTDLKGYENGANISASFTIQVAKIIGLGIDMNIYGAEPEYYNDGDLTSVGFEYLIYFQQVTEKFQPYFALGLGSYSNRIDSFLLEKKNGVGWGFVGKAGLKYFFDNDLFIGGYLKLFTNYQDIEDIDGTHTYNLGGAELNIELGKRF